MRDTDGETKTESSETFSDGQIKVQHDDDDNDWLLPVLRFLLVYG